jgi:hypothetical protein
VSVCSAARKVWAETPPRMSGLGQCAAGLCRICMSAMPRLSCSTAGVFWLPKPTSMVHACNSAVSFCLPGFAGLCVDCACWYPTANKTKVHQPAPPASKTGVWACGSNLLHQQVLRAQLLGPLALRVQALSMQGLLLALRAQSLCCSLLITWLLQNSVASILRCSEQHNCNICWLARPCVFHCLSPNTLAAVNVAVPNSAMA